MATRRNLDDARSYGRSIQPIHNLQAADGYANGNDVFAILDVSEIDADAQPKKITISGVTAALAPFIPTASGVATGPQGALQYNLNGRLSGSQNAIFTGSGIYASGVTSPAYATNLAAFNTITATGYTLSNTDNGRTVLVNSVSGVAVQIPAGLTAGFNCTLIQLASGQITVTSGTAVTVNSAFNSFKTTTRYSVMGVIGIETNSYIVTGDTTV